MTPAIMWCLLFLFAVSAAQDFMDTDPYYYETGYMSDIGGQDWSVFRGGRLAQHKCVEIPRNLTLCHNIGYTEMRLPNLLEHDSLREVTQQASSWVPLTNVNCHPDTQLFLCSLFSPICLDRPIPPCRNLCTAVRDACLSKMLHYGFPWPEMLRCDKFPLENDMCIRPQSEEKPGMF
jgi:secreted frizzled-related protein 5